MDSNLPPVVNGLIQADVAVKSHYFLKYSLNGAET